MAYYKEHRNINLPDYHSLGTCEEKNLSVLNAMDKNWLALDEPEKDSIVLFKVHGEPHVGVVLIDEWFIHVMNGTTVGLQRLNHPLWSKKIKGFYKYEQLV